LEGCKNYRHAKTILYGIFLSHGMDSRLDRTRNRIFLVKGPYQLDRTEVFHGSGGTVWFPAGEYLSFSIHLKSNITLFLDNGAYLIGADPSAGKGGYDPAEPNAFTVYQDFGHSHWHRWQVS